MFGFLALLLVYMALPLGQKSAGAVGGVVDLRQSDLSGAVYQLSGEWQVTHRRLAVPAEFPDDAPIASIPEKWPSSFNELNSYATYRLTIYTDDTRLLTLIVPEIYMAYGLWINGEYIRGAGVVADNPADSEPEFEAAIVPLKARDGVIEIVIQASNYQYMRPMMGSLLLLGEHESVNYWFFRSRSLYIIGLGVFVAGAFYHISLYIYRRKEVIFLLFSLLSMVCFWRYALDTNGISNITGWFSSNGGLLDLKIFLVLFFLHGVSISVFSLYVFDREWLTGHRFLALAYTVFGSALFGIIPWNTHLAPLIISLVMLPPVALTIIRAARSRLLRENKMMWLYFIALVLYPIVSVIQKYFFDHVLYMTGMIGDLFLLMAQALILSKKFADIHEAEQSLEEKNITLDRLNRMKTEVLQNLNHDLKTPLTVIATDVMNVADMLEFGIDEDQMRRNLDNAEREIMRMSRMITGAVKNSSVQDNMQDMKPLDVIPLLNEVIETFNVLIERYGNTLTLEVQEPLPPVFGNADMLMHVLSNLLSNANRYTRNGSITISAGAESIKPEEAGAGPVPNGGRGFVTIFVKDTGSGVMPDLMPRVFERGVSDSGTGLGLSICKSAIEAHGGTITINSEPGRGTVVAFTLPVCSAERRVQSGERRA